MFLRGRRCQGGQFIGRIDHFGGSPVTEAYRPSDLAATFFFLMGIKTDFRFRDSSGRPCQAYVGNPIMPLVKSYVGE